MTFRLKRVKRIIAVVIAALLALCGCSVNSLDNSRESRGGDQLPPEGGLGELTVYSFKAGKADAHLIYNSEFAMLIDCGEKGFGKEITAYLTEHKIKTLDMLVITHFDKDHVGGAAKVIKDTDIKRVFVTNFIKDSSEYNAYSEALAEKGLTAETLRNRTSIRTGGAEIVICPPLKEYYPDSPSNNASLMTVLNYGSCSLLFAADAEDLRLAEFMNTENARYDYVKVPYHGHMQRRLAPFLKMASPQIAVITSSDDQPEDQQVMKLLSDEGSAVYLTRKAPVIAVCDGRTVSAHYDE